MQNITYEQMTIQKIADRQRKNRKRKEDREATIGAI